ncbi:MAG: GNAT family N-acetyltransferase [Fusicatenibacter sp.]
MNITTKQFQILTDINLVWDFFVDIYDRERGGGVAAPFYEYAIQSSWMDTTYQYLNRFWFDGDQVVGFVFNEYPVTDIYFKVRPGYEFLAEEMVDYAINFMPDFDQKQQFILFNGQEFLMEEAKKRGFRLKYDYEDRQFDFERELNFSLPEGFHFVDPKDADPEKLARCCWYGFDHEDKGQFENWDRQDDSFCWTPQKAYKGVSGSIIAPSPHATRQYDVIIADEEGEYACYSGMWWVPENKLAYMEPLCTIPKYRRMGLASAALSKHFHTMKGLGATHMTGGGDPFYEKTGYGKGNHWYCWMRHWK